MHPSELYESLAGLALLALALVLRRRSEAAGRVSVAVVLGYLVLRMLVDLSRPTSSDAWCVRLVALAVLVLTVRSRSLRVRARHP